MKTLKHALLPLCLTVLTTACADSSTNPASPLGSLSAEGSAAKPPGSNTPFPGSVTFSDRSGDAITSDGGGTYVNGGRLEVSFYPASLDLVMKGGGGGSRTLSLDYTNRISGTGPVGTTQSDFMNIHHILDMARGTTRQALASFSGGTARGSFRFNPVSDPSATRVTVVRDLAGVWTVTADDPGTDRAALMRNGTAIGVYAMPFQLTAVCPACP